MWPEVCGFVDRAFAMRRHNHERRVRTRKNTFESASSDEIMLEVASSKTCRRSLVGSEFCQMESYFKRPGAVSNTSRAPEVIVS